MFQEWNQNRIYEQTIKTKENANLFDKLWYKQRSELYEKHLHKEEDL